MVSTLFMIVQRKYYVNTYSTLWYQLYSELCMEYIMLIPSNIISLFIKLISVSLLRKNKIKFGCKMNKEITNWTEKLQHENSYIHLEAVSLSMHKRLNIFCIIWFWCIQFQIIALHGRLTHIEDLSLGRLCRRIIKIYIFVNFKTYFFSIQHHWKKNIIFIFL